MEVILQEYTNMLMIQAFQTLPANNILLKIQLLLTVLLFNNAKLAQEIHRPMANQETALLNNINTSMLHNMELSVELYL